MANLKFERPKGIVELVKESENHARFHIKTLERGYGITLGNSLRRVLLSSVPGAAIVNIKIAGIDHEFSIIPGVYEDVMSIILALKQVVLKVDSTDPDFETKISISKVGPAKITAADFMKTSEVEIINPDLEIATLTEGATFDLDATVRRGAGYVSAEENKEFTKNEIGLIAIDSLFSPIKRVTYHIEKTRGDDDELFLDIETNGAITASDALSISAKMLIDYLEEIKNISENPLIEESFIVEKEVVYENPILKETLDKLADIKVPTYNALKRRAITTVAQLVSLTEKDLKEIPQIGPVAIKAIKESLAKEGLELKKEGE